MSKKGRTNHLAKALKESGFYPKDLPLPDRCTAELRGAIMMFLEAPKGKEVRRVVNAFRNISTEIFRGVGSVDHVTPGVREATNAYLEARRVVSKVPPANDTAHMSAWELRGGSV